MKMFLACCAVALVAGPALGQAQFVTSIPGVFTDVTAGTFLGGGDDASYPTAVAPGVANALFPTGMLNVCTNGHAGYGAPDVQYSNTPLPASFGYIGGVAAVFWDDLISAAAGAGIYTATDGNTLIVEWSNMSHYPFSPSGATFELKVFGAGTGPGGAYAQYIYHTTDFGDVNSGGESATIGFQFGPGAAVQYSYNAATVGTPDTVLTLVPVPAPGAIVVLGVAGSLALRRRRR